ncbi:MAG: type IV pilus assembly protein PilM [Elusimicrobia bacterium]|nr:type IV pilus assembly protein PilM [Elusimicrobiota bacterium]
MPLLSLSDLPFVRSKDAIAVDIGTYSIKILHIKKHGDSYHLVKWGTVPLADINRDISPAERKNAILSRLAEYLAVEKIAVKNIVTSVSGNQVIVRHVQLQKMSREELEKNIAMEAEPYIPFGITEVDLSFYILPGDVDSQKMDAIIVAAKKEVVSAKIEMLNTLNLRPVVVDIDAFAISNAYELNSDKTLNETVLIADIGASATNISIIANHVSKVVRDVYVAGNTFTKAVMKAASCDQKTAEDLKANNIIIVTPEDKDKISSDNQKLQVSTALTQTAKELLTEIQKSIDFYISQRAENTVNKILISGGSANIKNLDKYLSQQLKAAVEIFNPLRAIIEGEKVPQEFATEFAVSVGLGMRYENDVKK